MTSGNNGAPAERERSKASASIPDPAGRDKSKIREALAKVDNYHPVFGLEDEFLKPTNRNISRLCRDRCAFFESNLGRDIRQIRLLDVGCSMGYLSLYFASRGAAVTGIDNNPNQVEFCKTLAGYHKLASDFRMAEFNKSFCFGISEGEYDVILLLSVLHHVVAKYGLAETQAMMSRLLDVSDVLFVELARKEEDVNFSWKDLLPDRDLAIFDGLPDVQIEKLGEFPALNGSVSRPMYKVWRTKKRFNSEIHAPLEVRRAKVNEVDQPDRKYYLGPGLFTKAFVFDNLRPNVWSKFTAELYVCQQLGTGKHFCRFLGCEIRGRLGLITMERVDGPTLMDQIVSKKIGNPADAARQVVDILAAFDENGLYWNDFRSHNILVSNERFVAVDFESTSPTERENTLNLFLWLLYDLQSGRSMTHNSGIFKDNNMTIPTPPLALNDYRPELRSLAGAALKSADIHDLLANEIVMARRSG